SFKGNLIFRNCRLDLQTAGAGDLMAGVNLVRERRRSVNDRVAVPFGRSAQATDRFHEARFTLENPGHRRTDVVFRCYDDAIALRYELPAASRGQSVTITEEATSFGITGNPTAYAQYLENYTTSHEHNVVAVRYTNLRTNTLLDMPLTLCWENGTCAAIT